MGKLSRTKGHSYERETAIVFRQVFPKACRQLEYQEGLGVDLTNTGNLRIQCKRGKKYSPLTAIEEADGDGISVLVTQGDRKRSLVALPLEDFIKILLDPNHALRRNRDGLQKVSGENTSSGEVESSDDRGGRPPGVAGGF